MGYVTFYLLRKKQEEERAREEFAPASPESKEEEEENSLHDKTLKELKDMAKEHNISGSGRMGKDKLIEALSEVE